MIKSNKNYFLPVKPLMKYYTRILLLFCTIGFASASFSQSTKGQDFWFGFLDQLGSPAELTVYVTSDVNTTGTVSIPLQGWSQSFSVTAGVSTTITIPNAQGWTQSDNVVDTKGIHLWTEDCVNVFALNYYAYTADATVVLPTDAIGQDYYVLTGSENDGNVTGTSEMLIVASQNGTQINITPSVAATGHAAGATYSISLDSGQVYQLKASGRDLTGTHVWSTNNQDFSLFGGNMCTDLGGCTACDHLFDQIYSTDTWDTAFVTVPLKTRSHDIIKVLAMTAGTQVYRNGALLTTLNAGQSFQYNSSTSDYIQSTAPILMGQYSIGGSCDGGNGDPFYIVLSPLSRSLRAITFNAFASSVITNYYLNVTVETACINTVILDGSTVGAGSFTPVAGNPGYSTAQLDISQGDHTISSTCGVIATVYGYGSFESYGYSAGSNILIPYTVDFSPDTNICPGTLVTFKASGDTTDLLYKEWIFEADSPSVVGQAIASHTFNAFGVYTVKFVFEKPRACGKDTIEGEVNVSDSLIWIVGDTFICSPEPITLTTRTSASVGSSLSYLWNTGGTDSVIITTPQHDSLYSVFVNINNCEGKKYHFVRVKNDSAKFTAPTVCLGDSTVFNNISRVDSTTIYTWFWDLDDGTTLNTASAVHEYTDAGTYNVSLTVTAPATGCADTLTVPITVDPRPLPDFSFGMVCSGAPITFTNATTISPLMPLTYDWDFGDGSPHSSAVNPIHTYATGGNYTVILTASTLNGCSDTVMRVISAIPRFTPDFTATTVCMPDSVVFTNTSDTTNGGYNLAWTWNFADGNTDTLFQLNHAYASGGTYGVMLIADNMGCTDTVQQAVYVNYKPLANFSVNDICSRDTLFILDASTIGGGSMNYNWNYGDATSGTSSSHHYASYGDFTVSLTLTSDSGCVDTASRSVHVGKNNNVLFDVASVCEGTTSVFNNTTDTTGSGSVNWLWSFGDSGTANTEQTTHTYGNAGTYSVLLLSTTIDGCVDSLRKNAQVNDVPNTDFTFTNVCNGNALSFLNQTTVTGTVAYTWDFGDGTATSNAVSPTHLYSTFGQYSVLLVAVSDSGCVDSVRKTVTVYERAQPDFSAPPVCLNQTTNFLNQTPSGTFTVQTWDWNFGDGSSSAVNQPTHTYSAVGDYWVILSVTTTNGCTDSVQHTVTVNELPTVNSQTTDESCYNLRDGTISLSPTAGAVPLTYLWSDGAFSEDRNNLSAGSYSVTFTDQNGCTATASFALTTPPPILSTIAVQDVQCFGDSNGVVQATASGGTPPLTYLWSNDETDLLLENVPAGVYTLTITDGKGCELDTMLLVSQPDQMTLSITSLDSIRVGETIVLNTSYSSNNTDPLFAWSPSMGLNCTDCQNPEASPYRTTTYRVVMTDQNGCQIADSFTVYVNDEHSIYIPTAFSPNSDGNNDKYNAFPSPYLTYRMRLFNRWGEKVYETNIAGDNADPNRTGWDGYYRAALQSPGVYVYDIDVTFLDGKHIHKYGSFTLIR